MTFYLRTLEGDERPVGKVLPPIDCFRCGICCQCYQPQVDPEEAASIARALGMPTDKFIAKYVQMTAVGYLLRQKKDGCVFLDWEGNLASCHIHPFRPDACRDWVVSLARRECREGLARMKDSGKIMLPAELYVSSESAGKLNATLRNDAAKEDEK